MLYTRHNIDDLDLGKYSRFVAIGCSFTRWYWATWADLLAREMPDAHFVNIAKGGSGNQYIVTMLNILSRRHNFGPETLVGIMWSTFCREDRYVLENPRAISELGKGWHQTGNILNNTSKDFYRKEYMEPFHYLIRDASLISTSNQYLKNADFDTLNICSLDMTQQLPYSSAGYRQPAQMDDIDPTDKLFLDTINLYKDLEDDFVGYLMTKERKKWPGGHTYPKPGCEAFVDYHPRSIDYADYLESWGIPLSPDTRAFAQDMTNQIDQITDPEWQNTWPWRCMPNREDELNFFQNLF